MVRSISHSFPPSIVIVIVGSTTARELIGALAARTVQQCPARRAHKASSRVVEAIHARPALIATTDRISTTAAASHCRDVVDRTESSARYGTSGCSYARGDWAAILTWAKVLLRVMRLQVHAITLRWVVLHTRADRCCVGVPRLNRF